MASLPPIGNQIIRLNEIDSTNSFLLKERQHLMNHGVVVFTDNQIGGRGRTGRKFFSIPGKILAQSVVIHPSLPHDEMGIYSLLAGVAVYRTLQPLTTSLPRLKWPNDVLINQKKVCGILVEITHLPEIKTPVLVVGIGINCLGKHSEFPSELQGKITTLEEMSSKSIEIELVFQNLMANLEKMLQELEDEGKEKIIQEWFKDSNAKGANVQYETPQGSNEGKIEGLTESGYLLIRNKKGVLDTHISGDVSYSEDPYRS